MTSYPKINNNVPVEVKNSSLVAHTIKEHATSIVSSFTAIIRPSVPQNKNVYILRELAELKYRVFMCILLKTHLYYIICLNFPTSQYCTQRLMKRKWKLTWVNSRDNNDASKIVFHFLYVVIMYLITGQTLLCLFDHETCFKII